MQAADPRTCPGKRVCVRVRVLNRSQSLTRQVLDFMFCIFCFLLNFSYSQSDDVYGYSVHFAVPCLGWFSIVP